MISSMIKPYAMQEKRPIFLEKQWLLTHWKNFLVLAGFQKNTLVELYTENVADGYRVGEIYLGRVQKYVPSIQAYFVAVREDFRLFLPEKSVGCPLLGNRSFNGRLVEGDLLPVKIVRDAVGTKDAVCTADLSGLQETLNLSEGIHKKVGTCLWKPESGILSYLKERTNLQFQGIITDLPNLWSELKEAENLIGIERNYIRLYEEDKPNLATLFSLNSKLEECFNRIVWLPSGGNLYIDKTEAMTVIDVNSGKFSSKNLSEQQAAYQVNIEAIQETLRQIRIRNLSGIILVDLINQNKEMTQQLLNDCKELCRLETVQTHAVDITELGILELTRKKVYRNNFAK